jgi:ribonucleoside-diphosphate reductase alpha chain
MKPGRAIKKSAGPPPDLPLRLTPNALTVLKHRYLRKDSSGRTIETPAQMFWRVAQNVAEAEHRYGPPARAARYAREFYRLMTSLEFLPNSPTLMNAGRELQQLAACFVLPVEDSLDSIFEAVKNTALIHQSGGGTGFSFSHLRPRQDRVQSTSGVASGPVSFMKVFNTATEVIKQGGTRRGANMGILRVDHPDILEFITVKQDPKELTNFNLSVGITDGFMKAVEKHQEYDLINPRSGQRVKRLKAAEVFDRIVEAAWKTGEPGVVFLDRINRDNPTPHLGRIEATNPCAEQPLLPFEACNLGSINLTRMVKPQRGKTVVDYKKLERTIHSAVRFLDDIIDMNRYPLPEIEATARGNRKIGLGVMGFADLLIRMGIPYDTEAALSLAETLMAFIRKKAWEASAALAGERGGFPHFDGSPLHAVGRPRVRNATVTTIAPTGTLSIIAGCSSGIEPLYGVSTIRTAINDLKLMETHPLFVESARKAGIWSRTLQSEIGSAESIQPIETLPENIRRLFVTAHDIPPAFHVRMQAAFQKHTDNAVSKTVNFPENATPKDVREVFLLAYKEGCKGVTVYRSGSRDRQVLTCAANNTQYC